MAIKLSDFITMSLEDLQTPKPGRLCHGPAYWVVVDGNVLFYKAYFSPQCNSNQQITERFIKADYFDGKATVQYVPLSFIPHNCSDYV